jgi:FemAB-related protein (PEP-CTERM system-associated)
MRSRLFGHFLASVPFFDYGGLLADDPAAANQLAGAAVRLAEEVGAGHIELRQSMAADIPWQCQTHKVALAIQVSGNPEDHWSALSSRLRGKIRKARNSGARFEIAGPEKLGDFYRVFSRNMRDLGTPVYPRALFENAMKIFSGSAHLFLVYSGREPVAGALGLQSGDNIDLPWICSHYGFSSMYANEFLYWSVLEWTCRAGLRTLDLGRSTRDSGPHRFKSQWKPREKVQHWYCWTAPGQPPPQLSPESRKFRLAVRCWRKLPVPIAGIAGPRIAKYIP